MQLKFLEECLSGLPKPLAWVPALPLVAQARQGPTNRCAGPFCCRRGWPHQIISHIPIDEKTCTTKAATVLFPAAEGSARFLSHRNCSCAGTLQLLAWQPSCLIFFVLLFTPPNLTPPPAGLNILATRSASSVNKSVGGCRQANSPCHLIGLPAQACCRGGKPTSDESSYAGCRPAQRNKSSLVDRFAHWMPKEPTCARRPPCHRGIALAPARFLGASKQQLGLGRR
jgi:hypothetical protein